MTLPQIWRTTIREIRWKLGSRISIIMKNELLIFNHGPYIPSLTSYLINQSIRTSTQSIDLNLITVDQSKTTFTPNNLLWKNHDNTFSSTSLNTCKIHFSCISSRPQRTSHTTSSKIESPVQLRQSNHHSAFEQKKFLTRVHTAGCMHMRAFKVWVGSIDLLRSATPGACTACVSTYVSYIRIYLYSLVRCMYVGTHCMYTLLHKT